MNIILQYFSTLLNDLHIFEYISLCVISLLLNITLFKVIQLGYLGSYIKFKFITYLNNKLNLLTLYSFIFNSICLSC